MENKTRLHPLLSMAAISVSLFSLIGIGTVTGLLPHSEATKADAPAASLEAPAISTAPAPAAATAELVGVAAGPEQLPPALAKKPVVKKTAVAKPAPVKVADATPAAILPPPPAFPVPAPAATAPVAVAPASVAPACADCGTVENFRQVEVDGKGSGVGAVAGGATGAVIGHQFGRGSGKDLLTLAGAIGGAFAGHQVEKSARKSTRYEITVRMEDGSQRTVSQNAAPGWHIGDRVRVVGDQLVSNS